jgi:hypothetical protein
MEKPPVRLQEPPSKKLFNYLSLGNNAEKKRLFFNASQKALRADFAV